MSNSSNRDERRPQGAMAIYEAAATKFLIPLLFVMLTGMFTWMGKIEDRQYILQREAVSEQKLEATERRITSYIDIRLQDLDNKMNLIIRQLEIMNNQQRQQQQQ